MARPAKRAARKGAPAPRRKPKSGLGAFASLLLTLVLFAAAAGAYFFWEIDRPGPSTDAQAALVVPRGAAVSQIGALLETEGFIRNALVFRAASRLFAEGESMQAGEYEIPAGASVRAIIAMLVDGRSLLHPVTVAEGLTSATVVEILAASDVLTGPVPEVPPEGSLLPETYSVPRGTERAAVLRQMMDAHSETLADLWAHRAPNLPVTTPEEAVILASIVEKETGVASERPRVAAVFTNRLRLGMPLQSDPTIIYGVCRQFPARCRAGRLINERTGDQRGIRQSEIALDTGYNTYRIPRLPPTPISNPGRASIEAVLNPPATQDLYFVADGTGGHAFAATVAEHNRNVERWRQIERGQAPAP